MAFEAARERLVDRLRERGVVDGGVAEAIRSVPRHEFVPEKRRSDSYRDRQLPIGEGQTISAPHMVAEICRLVGFDAGDRVLEVGTGCGYHAAVAAELVGDEGAIHTVEYREPLATAARRRLSRLGYDDAVCVHVANGRDGWPERAPYDAAYLTCAPESIPDPVVKQVRPEGCVVAPVGDRRQRLVRLRRRPDGRTDREGHGGVRFVSMAGDE